MKRATPAFSFAAFLFMAAGSWAAPDPGEAVKAALLPEEQRILVAVLANPTEAKAFKDDTAKAGSDPAALEKTTVLWRAKVAAYTQSYLNREPKTNMAGKKIWEMVEPGEWAYVWNVVKLMEPGLKKSYVVGMIEDSNAELAKGNSAKALDTIKTARELMRDEFKKYSETDSARTAAAKAAPILLAEKTAREAREKAALEQAKRMEEEARKAAELAKNGKKEGAADKGGEGYDGGKNDDTVVVVPPADKAPEKGPETGTNPDPGPRPDLILGPSVPPEKKTGDAVPPPDLTAGPADPSGFEAELGEMKKNAGASLKTSVISAVVGAVAGALIGALCFGLVGAVIGAVAGAGGGWLFARKAL